MTKTIDERLIEWHRENLGAALRLGYDSDPIFMDALLEIRRLRRQITDPSFFLNTYPYTEMGMCSEHGEWRRSSGTGCPACQGLVER